LRDAVRVRDRLPALAPDLLGDLVGMRPLDALAVRPRAEIVDDDPGAASTQQPRIGPPEPERSAGTGDDCNLSVESQFVHVALSFRKKRGTGVDLPSLFSCRSWMSAYRSAQGTASVPGIALPQNGLSWKGTN